MTEMSPTQREKFLAKPRMATLAYVGKDGAPIAVPVWFDWDGKEIRVNSSVNSAKMKYLRQDPRMVLVVGNSIDEPECCVAFHGKVSILEDGVVELGEKITSRYWAEIGDPAMEERRSVSLEAFRRQEGDSKCFTLEMIPDRIKSHWEAGDPGENF